MTKGSPYISSFADSLSGYIELRTALGYSERTYKPRALNFDRFCAERFPDITQLNEELATSWIIHGNPTTTVTGDRCSFIRLFGEYLRNIGKDAYIFPEEFYPRHSREYIPYIFSSDEMKSFFHEVDAYECKEDPFIPILLSVYFRLAYTCGLRPGETRVIMRDNVNLVSGEILIKNTKNKKDRYVVASDAMRELLVSYCFIRDAFYAESRYLFPNASGDCYRSGWFQRYYKKFFSDIHPEIPAEELPAVRVYDLRHMFASNVIHKWVDSKEDLSNRLPFLQTYMGHSSLAETAYYVHIIPERLSSSEGIDWESLNAVIPEVRYEER